MLLARGLFDCSIRRISTGAHFFSRTQNRPPSVSSSLAAVVLTSSSSIQRPTGTSQHPTSLLIAKSLLLLQFRYRLWKYRWPPHSPPPPLPRLLGRSSFLTQLPQWT